MSWRCQTKANSRVTFCILQQVLDATISIDIVEGRTENPIESGRLVESRSPTVV